ncbi:hypothetical protein HEK616_28150 [Streptomyces nigrescens]|uniref:Uncharacterized protein n=1 Tax=Streptomyces nigrescens TaxID=1920 RepID=A0ABN6QT56_STRNI|nr:DUF6333 family protein [Streptomyces nigrescens]BDM69328.1 hypothetical protein HEK616_28150 [Streptomyces nigrescens]
MNPVSPGTQVDLRHHGHAHLVIVHPPFTAPLPPTVRPATVAHDPAAAKAAVLSLSTVSAIRRQDAPSRLEHPGHPASREELDEVRAAVWGSTVKITDPALVEDGIMASALEDEFQAQKQRHPHSRIIAVCERDFGASYSKILVAVPGAPDLTVEGFEELEVTGDPRTTLTTAGIDPGQLSDEYGDGEEEFSFHNGDLLHMLTGGALSVYVNEERRESAFVVDRSEEGEDSICEVWFP